MVLPRLPTVGGRESYLEREECITCYDLYDSLSPLLCDILLLHIICCYGFRYNFTVYFLHIVSLFRLRGSVDRTNILLYIISSLFVIHELTQRFKNVNDTFF